MLLRPTAIISSITFLLWCLFALYASETVYWRDSGEFLLSAFFLDIPHPAGFPTYSAFANLFSLLPIGPIAWRVNIFSAFCAAVLLGMSTWFIYRLLHSTLKLDFWLCLPLSFVPAVIAIGSEAFLHQALLAEVYQLNALLMVATLVLFLEYRLQNDHRFLMLAAFLSGIAVANHVSFLFFVVGSLPLLLWLCRRRVWRAFGSLVLIGLLGMMLYLYIPIRANTYPPLNTGGAITLDRFFGLVTDRRDRHLRPEAVTEIAGRNSRSLSDFFRSSRNDILRLAQEVRPALLVISLAGFLVLLPMAFPESFLLAVFALSNWLFFKGWQPDPWQPLLLFVGFGVAIAMALSVRVLLWKPVSRLVGGAAVLLFLFFYSVQPLAAKKEFTGAVRDFELAAQTVEDTLTSAPQGAVMVLEQSWFMARYLHAVEGLRPDISLTYLPQLLFPEYFSPAVLRGQDRTFHSYEKPVSGDPLKPSYSHLSTFVQFVSLTASPLLFEPVAAVNGPLREIALLTGTGFFQLEQGRVTEIAPSFSNRYQRLVGQVRSITHPRLYEDSLNYLEAAANGAADLLSQVGNHREAATLLALVCGGEEVLSCSTVSINNLAVYLLKSLEYNRSATVLARHIARSSENGTLPEEVRLNFEVAFSKVVPEDRPAVLELLPEEYRRKIEALLKSDLKDDFTTFNTSEP